MQTVPSERHSTRGAFASHGAGSSVAAKLYAITQEACLALYDLFEVKGEHVHLDWTGEARWTCSRRITCV